MEKKHRAAAISLFLPRFLSPSLKQALVFLRVRKSFENTVEKGEIARNEQFLLSPQFFLLFWRPCLHLHKTVVCELFQFGRS